MRRLILAVLMFAACGAVSAAAGASPPAPVSDLEKLFEAGQYQQFQARAQALAKKGDPEAHYLIGKAHHMGKGVPADADQARNAYERAAEKNHPRAIHNLGLLLLDREKDPKMAIPEFERALALGLKTPTLYNLGRAHKGACIDWGSDDSCTAATDIFMGMWQKDKDTGALDELVVVYASRCFSSGSGATPPTDECKLAVNWAEKGAALGLGRSAYNRGAIEHDAKRYDKALPWFKRAVEHGEGLGAYSLGKMYEEGLGVPKDEAEALAWFKRGAALKNAYAVKRMAEYWDDQVRTAEDQAQVKAAMAEEVKLHNKDYMPHRALGRLKTMETLALNKKILPPLAGKAIYPTLCQLTIDQYNADWWIVPLAPGRDGDEEQNRLAVGKVNIKGCLTISAAGLAEVRKAMALGKTPVLHWPGQARLLSLVPGPGGKLMFLAETTEYAK